MDREAPWAAIHGVAESQTQTEHTHTHNAHSSTVYSSQVMEANHVSINRHTDKEAMVFIYSGIFLSHEKELNSLICSNVDGPREYYA